MNVDENIIVLGQILTSSAQTRLEFSSRPYGENIIGEARPYAVCRKHVVTHKTERVGSHPKNPLALSTVDTSRISEVTTFFR